MKLDDVKRLALQGFCPNGHLCAAFFYVPEHITREAAIAEFERVRPKEERRCKKCELSDVHFVDAPEGFADEMLGIAAQQLRERVDQLGGDQAAFDAVKSATLLGEDTCYVPVNPDVLQNQPKGRVGFIRLVECRCENGHILGGACYPKSQSDVAMAKQYREQLAERIDAPCTHCRTTNKTIECGPTEFDDLAVAQVRMQARHMRERHDYDQNVTQRSRR